MNGQTATQFRPPRDIEAMVEAYRQHCQDGGEDFIEYLKPWHCHDALATINDAAQNYTAEAAMPRIKRALKELFEIAAEAHREALEWEGVDG